VPRLGERYAARSDTTSLIATCPLIYRNAATQVFEFDSPSLHLQEATMRVLGMRGPRWRIDIMRRIVLVVGALLLIGCNEDYRTGPSRKPMADVVTDVTPPTLTAFSLSPTSVNTSDALAQVNATFTVTDNNSGVTLIKVYFINPSGTVAISAFGSFPPAATQSGSLVLSFPQYSESGTWSVEFIEVDDAAGNSLFLTAQDVAALGFPTAVTVSSSAQDLTPPALTALSFSPMTISPSLGLGTVTINFMATDDLSGVSLVYVAFCGPSGTSGSISGTTYFTPATSVKGSLAITFPQSAEVGTWTICGAEVRDGTGNVHGYGSQDLTALGFPTALLVVNVITVSIDIQPGEIPNSINPTKQGTVPVAILSSPGFDAPARVNRASLTFGRTGNEASLAFCGTGADDVNGDGLLDIVCHFYAQRTGFQVSDLEGVMRGLALDGVPIEGRDLVRIIK
jgi:hypothetical protein